MTKRALFKFRLYVADNAPNSLQAMANLTAFCDAYLPERHEIDIVDVFKEPKRALTDGIFMTPTLVNLSPEPLRKIVGALSQTSVLLLAFGLEPLAA